MKRLLLLIVLVLAAHPLFANCGADSLIVNPPRPTTSDDIEVVVRGGCSDGCVPHSPKVTVAAGTITIEMDEFDGCILIPVPFGERIDVGRVPAGSYTVIVKTERTELARQTLVVRNPPFVIRPSFGASGSQVVIETSMAELCPHVPCELPPVYFGGVPSVPHDITGAGYPIVTVPQRAPGIVDVTVTRPGQATLVAEQAFLIPEPQADLSAEYERVLFPAAFEGPGAHGSLWTSENVVANTSNALITTANYGVLGRTQLRNTDRDGGAFLFVPNGTESSLVYSSHIVDRSRRQTNAGTELPVVHEDQAGSRVTILNVPLTEESRQTLRIYDFDAIDGRDVTVSVQLPGGTNHNLTATLRHRIVCVTTPCYPEHPTYAVINLDSILQLRGKGAADITIVAKTNETPLWAFVSVTNNDTQHVTTFSPQHRRRTLLP